MSTFVLYMNAPAPYKHTLIKIITFSSACGISHLANLIKPIVNKHLMKPIQELG